MIKNIPELSLIVVPEFFIRVYSFPNLLKGFGTVKCKSSCKDCNCFFIMEITQS